MSLKKYGAGELTEVEREPQDTRRTASWTPADDRELEEENRDHADED